jgi:hypothetical protein
VTRTAAILDETYSASPERGSSESAGDARVTRRSSQDVSNSPVLADVGRVQQSDRSQSSSAIHPARDSN